MKCLEESGNIFSEKAQSDNEEMMQSSKGATQQTEQVRALSLKKHKDVTEKINFSANVKLFGRKQRKKTH